MREYIEEVLPEIDLGTQNASKINFAEAALVLQNSSHVYSRKVEHLYNLVYQALEGMTSAGQNSTNNRKGKSQDIDDFFDFDPHQEFLLLDDILPTDDTDDCRQINLNENHEENVNYSGMVSSIDISNTIVEHQVKAASMVTSLRLADGNCEMGANGCLFLPGTQEAASRMESTDTDPTAAHHNDYPMDDGFDDDDDDQDGAGFALADNDFRENYTGDNSQERRNVSFAPDIIPRKNDPWELLDPHKVDKKSKPKPLRIGKTIRLPEGIDSLPSDCVNGTSTQRVARVQPKPLPPQVPVISIASQTFQATLRKRRHESPSKDDPIPEAPTAPIQGLAFGNEFAYIAKANAKRKAAERREKRKLERKQPMSQEAYEEYEDDDHDDGGFPMYDDDDNDVDESTGNTGFVSLDQAYKGNSDLNDDNNGMCTQRESFVVQTGSSHTFTKQMKRNTYSHLKTCVEPICVLLQKVLRSMQPRRIFLDGWVTGRNDLFRYSKKRRRGASSIFIYTERLLLLGLRKKSNLTSQQKVANCQRRSLTLRLSLANALATRFVECFLPL